VFHEFTTSYPNQVGTAGQSDRTTDRHPHCSSFPSGRYGNSNITDYVPIALSETLYLPCSTVHLRHTYADDDDYSYRSGPFPKLLHIASTVIVRRRPVLSLQVSIPLDDTIRSVALSLPCRHGLRKRHSVGPLQMGVMCGRVRWQCVTTRRLQFTNKVVDYGERRCTETPTGSPSKLSSKIADRPSGIAWKGSLGVFET